MSLKRRGSPLGALSEVRPVAAICILTVVLALPLGAPAATTGVSPLVSTMEFSVGPPQLGAPSLLPAGTPPSWVRAEQVGPFIAGGPGDSADDDVYRAELTLPGPLPFSNAKIIDDGLAPLLPLVGTGIAPPPLGPPPFPPPPGAPPPPQATIPTDQENIDALALEGALAPIPATPEDARDALLSGILFVQFSVDNTPGQGLPGTGVLAEASAVSPEHPGDVYQASPASPFATNVVIVDEDAAGLALLWPPPTDDLDGLILQQSIFDFPAFEDTDGVGGADTPYFYFSTDKAFPGTLAPVAPADVLAPGPAGGQQPFPVIPAAALGLVGVLASPPYDNIDALYIDAFSGAVLFSLSIGSPSLATIPNLVTAGPGAAPGDIIHAVPGASPPIVVVGANEIGLQGVIYGDGQDDELNALWVTDVSLEAPLEIPVELSVFSSD